MLIPRRVLEGIASGSIDLAFRRWDRARVNKGTSLRTAIGVLEVKSIDAVAMTKITEREAKRAGYASRAELLEQLRSHGSGKTFRIALKLVGADPRIALRQKTSLSAVDVDELEQRLGRMDKASRRGPWTTAVLNLIAKRPGVRAPDLAGELGRETRLFKADVRKLKELGLTESLEVGYRLSPRGRAWLKRAARR